MTASASVARWAVVIPGFNNADDTIACIQSVWSARPRPERIVLADDASTDKAVEKVVAWAQASGIPAAVEGDSGTGPALRPGLTILTAERNEGFNVTSNKGLACVRERTDAPYVLLLNNDAVVTGSFFAELAAAIEHYPGVGVVGGTIYEWDRTTVWYAGGRYRPLRALSTHDTTLPAAGTPWHTDWVSGCAMLISRDVLDSVGTLAPCFSPCYSEDVDYSLRARAAGFQIIVVPKAVAYHRVGASLGRPGRQRPEVVYAASRNRAFVLRRNYQGMKRLAGIAYLSVTKPLRAAAQTLRGRPRTGWATLAGTIDGLLNPAAEAPVVLRSATSAASAAAAAPTAETGRS